MLELLCVYHAKKKKIVCVYILGKFEEPEKKRKHGGRKEKEIMLGDNMDVCDDNGE